MTQVVYIYIYKTLKVEATHAKYGHFRFYTTHNFTPHAAWTESVSMIALVALLSDCQWSLNSHSHSWSCKRIGSSLLTKDLPHDSVGNFNITLSAIHKDTHVHYCIIYQCTTHTLCLVCWLDLSINNQCHNITSVNWQCEGSYINKKVPQSISIMPVNWQCERSCINKKVPQSIMSVNWQCEGSCINRKVPQSIKSVNWQCEGACFNKKRCQRVMIVSWIGSFSSVSKMVNRTAVRQPTNKTGFYWSDIQWPVTLVSPDSTLFSCKQIVRCFIVPVVPAIQNWFVTVVVSTVFI